MTIGDLKSAIKAWDFTVDHVSQSSITIERVERMLFAGSNILTTENTSRQNVAAGLGMRMLHILLCLGQGSA
jgi:hypothetical protein